MVAIIDYDAGNLKSVQNALRRLGESPVVTREPEELLKADHVILPGVGAFGDAMDKLSHYQLIPVIQEVIRNKTPFLGVCLGMQLLFDSSEESPDTEGLHILKGKVLRIPDAPGLKIPHMGWNSLHFDHPGRLFTGLKEGVYVYFVHSYYLKAEDPGIVTASTEYGTTIHASVESGNVFGCQFHPEKSSDAGMKMLQSFLDT